MKNPLRPVLLCLACLIFFMSMSGITTAAGVTVTVPYASSDNSWWTGLAITNLDTESSTGGVTVVFWGEDGALLGQSTVGPIGPSAAYVDMVSNIYSGSLPSRYKLVISHPGNEPIAATAFLGNAEGGFGYQSYASNSFTKQPGTEITSLPCTISSPGKYYFTRNLDSTSHGILVEADNVTIDMMGFTMTGPGKETESNHGIRINGQKNFEIRDGIITEFGESGIREMGNGIGHTVEKVKVYHNGANGISINGYNHIIKNCIVYENDDIGIWAGNGAIISSNAVYKNGSHGMYVNRSLVIHNLSHENEGMDIAPVTANNNIIENYAWSP